MKKYTLALAMLGLLASPAFADGKKKAVQKVKETTTAAAQVTAQANVTQAPQEASVASTLSADNMAFQTDTHDFGTVQEGGAADYMFTFVNTGKEPIIIQRAQPSCGCTASDWTKEPILPGKTGYVKASYGTQGRPGPFTKTITVLSNAGAKVLTFKGEVEKAPSGSVPENSSSMIKTN